MTSIETSQDLASREPSAAAILVWAADENGACTFVNDEWRRFTGCGPDDALGETWRGSIHPDDLPTLDAAYVHARETGAPFEVHYRLRRADGEWRWVLDRARPLADGRGYVGGAIDVHDRTEAEEQARALLHLAQAAERDSNEARALLDSFFDTSPVGLGFYDTDLRYQRINPVLADVHGGAAVETYIGRRPDEIDPVNGARRLEILRGVLRDRRPVRDVPFTVPASVTGGPPRRYVKSFFPVTLPDGDLVGVGVIAHDVSERERAADAQRRALLRSQFLADATAVLDASLDVEVTLRSIADLAVERIADWCVVEMPVEDGAITPVAIAHRDPERAQLARRMREEHPPSSSSFVARVLATGTPVLVPEITEEDLVRTSADAEHLERLRALGLGSGMTVPLAARGRVFGAISLVAEQPGAFGPDDLAFAQELGRRAALAVDNARLYAEARAQQRRSDEAHATLDALIERAPIGLASFDTDLRFVRVNAALAEMNGVPQEAHVGRRLDEVLPEIAPQVAAQLERVLATGEPVVGHEIAGTTPSRGGRRRHFSASYYRVRLPDGETLGLGATVVDLTDRKRAEDALRAQRDLYEALLRAQSEMGEGFVLIDGERVVYANEAAERIAGRSASEIYGLPHFLDVIAEDEQPRAAALLAELAAGTRDEIESGFETALLTPGGVRVAIEVAAKALDADGVRRLVVILRDISDRKRQQLEREQLLAAEQRARRETERLHARASFLAEISGVLERSLDLRAMVGEVADRLAGTVCDAVTITVLHRDGIVLERVGAAARDPDRNRAIAALRGTTVDVRPDNPTAGVVFGGRPYASGDLPDETMERSVGGGRELAALRAAWGRSILALPLVARGHVVGSLNLSWLRPGSVPEGPERQHLEEIARRVARGVDNAQLYAERAEVASTLQASLLPPELPSIPRIGTAARYLPASEATAVGGDFYDVFRAAGGDWQIVVGDVCGKGAEAASVTAMARWTLRTAAIAQPRTPAESLALLNAAMLSDVDEVPERFLTAVLASLQPRPDGGADATIALAGHPAPVLLRADGTASPVGAPGTLLGVDRTGEWPETVVRLEPGDALIFYTDGVTEADRRAPLTATELADTLVAAIPPGADASLLADATRALAEGRAAGPLPDDLAIVALRLEP